MGREWFQGFMDVFSNACSIFSDCHAVVLRALACILFTSMRTDTHTETTAVYVYHTPVTTVQEPNKNDPRVGPLGGGLICHVGL